MAEFKKINNWDACKTINEQGVNFREVIIDGKISKLQFTIKPNSVFWRAGFKLVDPNGVVLPLRGPNSLLFHLGSTPSDEQYGFTAYLNGDQIKILNKTNKYPNNRSLSIRLEINHDNFLKVYVNGSLEFKPSWHLENPNIREKIVLLAWGDEHDYSVNFRNISAWNWKGLQKNKLLRSKMEQTTYSIFETWWMKYIFFPLVVLLIGTFLIYSFGWTSQKIDTNKRKNFPTLEVFSTGTPMPTIFLPSSTPVEENKLQRISLGDSYFDSRSKLIIGISNIHALQTADISITAPGSDTEYHKDVFPGKAFYFTSGIDKYTLIVKEINYIGSYVDIIIN